MSVLFTVLVTFFAGMGAGLGTGKADPIIRRGRAVQNAFFKRLLDHVEPADQEVFFRTMELIGKNLDEILKENA